MVPCILHFIHVYILQLITKKFYICVLSFIMEFKILVHNVCSKGINAKLYISYSVQRDITLSYSKQNYWSCKMQFSNLCQKLSKNHKHFFPFKLLHPHVCTKSLCSSVRPSVHGQLLKLLIILEPHGIF